MQSVAIIDYEAFSFHKVWTIKELAVCRGDANNCLQISFRPPIPWGQLSLDHRTSVRYQTQNVHKIPWRLGDLEVGEIQGIVQRRYTNQNLIYLAKGEDKSRIIARLIEAPVYNLEQAGCPKIDTLYRDSCETSQDVKCLCFPTIHNKEGFKHCAVKKARFITEWVKDNDPESIIQLAGVSAMTTNSY
jgi:hypothetical protein